VVALSVTGMGRVMASRLVGVWVTVVMRMGVVVIVVVVVFVFVFVFVIMTVGMRVGVARAIGVGVLVGVGKGSRNRSRSKIKIKIGTGRGREVDVEFGAGDQGFLTAGAVEVITFEAQFLEAGFESMEVNAEIDKSPDKHVAADAAEQIQVKGLHGATVLGCEHRALIWAAA
jgi:hypothetical protein